ncbi:unnamed protein product [Fusarium graminearum]|uniref:Chromosome 2, complete genome n=1 Tax=Gibberella zeae (strain ATCC MYA-4620 / CBS 123657 / FGSC 9075 / NRRL 31084 / PH-1) TaxID=229533 RepID=I1RVE3_GIBZE|nr:hypothetical protein FGSG_08214 [Fusarium graminearum PH-1]ESU15168.1 hypothetical protein FGSG_08214 [Fusarium graminearum PH-1]CAF3488635.1 unnamed protein product [Fusarium graminearum]CEF76496.1 unnamed protein product [Fusarium graminearum]CZS79789.1 unnamed protein product [Fusarium graminearum]|eukprot:XP_011320593.1 hypothetical protein FGSG_08214 [Fusarium graminearum PH-1]
MPPVPPPLPPAPSPGDAHPPLQPVPPPAVSNSGPPSALLLHLAIHSGGSFKNHWGYFIQSKHNSSVGTIVHVVGDVKNGFEFEIKRNHDFDTTSPAPLHIIPLQWMDGKYFNEAMLNNGVQELDHKPVCDFEKSVYKIKPPKGSLNSATSDAPRARVDRKDCQTWILQSADQLVADGIMHPDIAAYLEAIKQ